MDRLPVAMASAGPLVPIAFPSSFQAKANGGGPEDTVVKTAVSPWHLVWSARGVMVALVVLTVTVKVQSFVFPAVSVAWHCTIVVPSGKVEPEGGLHTTDTPGQLSVAFGVA